jgi:hypothetical protein
MIKRKEKGFGRERKAFIRCGAASVKLSERENLGCLSRLHQNASEPGPPSGDLSGTSLQREKVDLVPGGLLLFLHGISIGRIGC